MPGYSGSITYKLTGNLTLNSFPFLKRETGDSTSNQFKYTVTTLNEALGGGIGPNNDSSSLLQSVIGQGKSATFITGSGFVGSHLADNLLAGGDNVVVINAEKVSLSGDKWSQKQYISHTGYPGGQRIITADKLHKKNNIKLVEKAVKGMLPKNKLGADLFRNLKVFPGSEHDHEAQKPK